MFIYIVWKTNVCQINYEINNQIANIHITETKSKLSETFVTKYVCIKQFDWALTEHTPHILIPLHQRFLKCQTLINLEVSTRESYQLTQLVILHKASYIEK